MNNIWKTNVIYFCNTDIWKIPESKWFSKILLWKILFWSFNFIIWSCSRIDLSFIYLILLYSIKYFIESFSRTLEFYTILFKLNCIYIHEYLKKNNILVIDLYLTNFNRIYLMLRENYIYFDRKNVNTRFLYQIGIE